MKTKKKCHSLKLIVFVLALAIYFMNLYGKIEIQKIKIRFLKMRFVDVCFLLPFYFLFFCFSTKIEVLECDIMVGGVIYHIL